MRLLLLSFPPSRSPLRWVGHVWLLLALLALSQCAFPLPGCGAAAGLWLAQRFRSRRAKTTCPAPAAGVLRDISDSGVLNVQQARRQRLCPSGAVHVGPWGCVLGRAGGHSAPVIVGLHAIPQRQLRALQRSLRQGQPLHGGVQGSGRFPVSL